MGAIVGPLIALGLLFLWLRRRWNTGLGGVEEYDEEGGETHIGDSEGILDANAPVEIGSGKIWRSPSRQSVVRRDHERRGSIISVAVQKIRGTDRATSTENHDTNSNTRTGTALLGGGADSVNSSESNFPTYGGDGPAARVSARKNSDEFPSSSDATEITNPGKPFKNPKSINFCDSPGPTKVAATDSNPGDTTSTSYSNHVCPAGWLQESEIPGMSEKTTSAIMTELDFGHIPIGAAYTHRPAVANRIRHSRAFGHGVPPGVVRRNMMRPGGKFLHAVPVTEDETATGPVLDWIAPKGAQDHRIPEKHP